MFRMYMQIVNTTPGARWAEIVKAKRDERGWTQAKLAELANVSQPTILRWERKVPASALPVLMEVLDLEWADLDPEQVA
jgi:transcriptional regulator with XRE-family HTH domain